MVSHAKVMRKCILPSKMERHFYLRSYEIYISLHRNCDKFYLDI